MIMPRWALPVGVGLALIATHWFAYTQGESAEESRQNAKRGIEAVAAAGELAGQYAARDAAMAEVEFQRAALENELEKALNENRSRDDRIASGAERVYVRAACPAVPSTASNAGGSAPVAAELDPRYRHVVSRLRENASRWEAWGRKCQVELNGRSANKEM